jgi:excisionase family DNA binding protein
MSDLRDGRTESIEKMAKWKPEPTVDFENRTTAVEQICTMKKLTFAEFCVAFNLGPFAPLRQACKVEGVGLTKLYELVRDGKLHLYKNGKRSSIPAQELYDRYVQRLEAWDRKRAHGQAQAA